ncbi:MAG: SpoIID/LytB domain-containing protein [Clostridiales bacterium]|jgi:stage II sporulation protein D|nr:SpoIID/LytB domain-containing protein [Clostridiales bacterium]
MNKFMKLKATAGILVTASLLLQGGPPRAFSAPAGQLWSFDDLRVGLTEKYKDVSRVSIDNSGVTAGFELGGQFFESAVLNSGGGFAIQMPDHYYIRAAQPYADYESAKAAANALPITAVPCLVGVGAWAVYIGGYQNEAAALSDLQLLGLAAEIVQSGEKALSLKNGDLAAILFDSPDFYPQLAPAGGGSLDLGDRTYRGRVEFGRYSGGGLTAVNVVSVEEYLYSAVPSEMPSGWPAEALKSQACAARNYAVVNREKHEDADYGLCDGIHCQTYLGADNEANSTTAAVNATAGQLILYNGEPIDAVFFSSSGGATDDSGNVWVNDVPYLKSVREINETQAKIWTRTIPLSALDQALAAHNETIGAATGLSIGSYNNAGRVAELIITGTNGQVSLKKDEIRTYFSGIPGGSLESRNFTLSAGAQNLFSDLSVTNGVETARAGEMAVVGGQDALSAVAADTVAVIGSGGIALYAENGAQQSTGTDIVISGRGWGHGVGMSQFGALGMAEMGYDYKQILEHYYTSVTVE